MSYATAQDLHDRYPTKLLARLTGDVKGETVDDDRLTTALDDASSEVDTFLQDRYTLPLATVPKVLVRVVCDIAVYRLEAMMPQQDVKDVHERYQANIGWLGMVRDGKVNLGLDEADAGVPEHETPETSGPDRVFSRDTLRGY